MLPLLAIIVIRRLVRPFLLPVVWRRCRSAGRLGGVAGLRLGGVIHRRIGVHLRIELPLNSLHGGDRICTWCAWSIWLIR